MIREKIKHKKGFTIIEVVLVLAIAGLIFLMVFIALPALQSSQRNTERENSLERFIADVTEYASNNSGRIPFPPGDEAADQNVISRFVARYIDTTCDESEDFMTEKGEDECTGGQFRDPDGTIYHFARASVDSASTGEAFDVAFSDGGEDITTNNHTIYYAVGYSCGPNEGTVIEGTGNRQVALLMILEGGSVACNANS